MRKLSERQRWFGVRGSAYKYSEDERRYVSCFKNAFLAELVYENIGLRAIGDVDLLVKT